jgi:dTDP-4-dehydrorhamnose 3,5-epimerase-like enzyme
MNNKASIIIDLPKITDQRGNLTFIEGLNHIPFQIKRVYYLYDVPAEAERGAHGHKKLEQFVVPLAGSFEFVLDDGFERKSYYLKKPWQGLYIPPMMWRELKDFSSGAVCLVLASELYDEADYFRDYNEFLQAATNQPQYLC